MESGRISSTEETTESVAERRCQATRITWAIVGIAFHMEGLPLSRHDRVTAGRIGNQLQKGRRRAIAHVKDISTVANNCHLGYMSWLWLVGPKDALGYRIAQILFGTHLARHRKAYHKGQERKKQRQSSHGS